METLIMLILAAIGALLALVYSLKPFIDDNRVRGKVLNFDEGMRHYFFRLPNGAEALRAALEQQQAAPLDYRYDASSGTVTFARENVEAAYRLDFYEHAGQSGLRVGRVAEEREKGPLPYLVNAFFITGFGAKPVDFRKFPAMFPEDGE